MPSGVPSTRAARHIGELIVHLPLELQGEIIELVARVEREVASAATADMMNAVLAVVNMARITTLRDLDTASRDNLPALLRAIEAARPPNGKIVRKDDWP